MYVLFVSKYEGRIMNSNEPNLLHRQNKIRLIDLGRRGVVVELRGCRNTSLSR